MLAVGQGPAPVGKLQQLPCMAVAFPAVVDLQLHPKVTGSGSMENRLRLIVVVLDSLSVGRAGMAAVAERLFLSRIILRIVCLVHMQQRAAADAVGIMPVIAAPAERGILVPRVVVLPEPFPANMADVGLPVQAVATELLAVQDYPLPQRVLVSADRANKGLRFHLVSSFHCKINTDAEDSGGSGQQELNKRVPLAAVLIEIALVCFSFP